MSGSNSIGPGRYVRRGQSDNKIKSKRNNKPQTIWLLLFEDNTIMECFQSKSTLDSYIELRKKQKNADPSLNGTISYFMVEMVIQANQLKTRNVVSRIKGNF